MSGLTNLLFSYLHRGYNSLTKAIHFQNLIDNWAEKHWGYLNCIFDEYICSLVLGDLDQMYIDLHM